VAGEGEGLPLAPDQEIVDRIGGGSPRVAVSNGGGEEFDEAASRVVDCLDDDCGQENRAVGAS